MVWPFSSSKPSSELSKELPENLRDFFDEANPEKHQSIFEESPHHKRVNQVLLRHENDPYNFELDKYKRTEKPIKVTAINCAEIQQQVIECFRAFTMTSSGSCKSQITKHTHCVELQNRALKRLYYDECVSTHHCDKIRYIVDQLFTQNFGQYGDNISEETKANFDNDLDKVFYKVWR